MITANIAILKNPDLQFRILDQRIRVRFDDELYKSLVSANYRAFLETECSAEVELEYNIAKYPSGGFYISSGDKTLVEVTNNEALQYDVVYFLEKLITIDLQKQRTDLYFVHSSALERNGGVIMIAAESGTGKSTTAWALLQHGFQYLSDELAPIDPARMEVHPYPHALCLKSTPPGPYPLPDTAVRTERTIHIPVTSLPVSIIRQPTPLRALIFLQRDTDVDVPTYAEVSPAEAGARLYANTLNALAHPGKGLDVAVNIASSVPAFTLHAGELRATCELISDLDTNLQ